MKLSQLKSGFILSYAAIFIQSAVSIIYTPVMLRLLGQSDYGLLQLAVSAIANLGILSFGFSGSYLRFYSQFRAKDDERGEAKFNGMYAMIFAVIALIALLSGGAVTAFSERIFSSSLGVSDAPALKKLLGIMTVNLSASFLCSVFDAYITAKERFTFQKIIIIISSFLNPMLTLPLLLTGFGSMSVAACMTAVTLFKLCAEGLYCILRLGMKFAPGFNGELFKRLCSFSFFIFLNIISDQINWNADKTLLGIFRTTDDVALYSLGAQFNTYFLTFSYALSSLFSPRAYRLALAEDNDALSEFFARFGRLQLCVMGFIFLLLIAAGKPFIRLWSGIDSDIPYYTAVILIAPLLVTSAQSIGIEIQRAKDMHRFRSVLYFVIAVGNIALSIPLCIRFGAVGCAAGTCVCLVIGNIIIMNFYYALRVKLNMKRYFTEMLRLMPAFIAPAVCAAVLNRFLGGDVLSVIVGIALFSAVYIFSVWNLGVQKDLKQLGLM